MQRRLSDLAWMAFFAILYPSPIVEEQKPKIIPRLCNRDDTKGGCPERMEAQARGEFFPDFENWGYVRTDIPLRKISGRAHYFIYVERQDLFHPDHSGKPFTWSNCPWCGEELPSMGRLRKEAEKPIDCGEGAE